MSLIIGVISQKGGVGKSTISRLIAREYANAQWNVKIADLDIAQGTSFNWQTRRLQNNIQPEIPVERFRTVEQALKITNHYDLVIIDSPPHSSEGTLKIAKHSDLCVLPTGLSLDDLEPSILLAHELIKKGIHKSKIVFALCKVGTSKTELIEARNYINEAGYFCLEGELPEKTAYRRASDEGLAFTETKYKSLNNQADILVQSIIDCLSKINK